MRIPWDEKCDPWDDDDCEAERVQWQSKLLTLILESGMQRPWSLATGCMPKSYHWTEQVADGLGIFLVIPLLIVNMTIRNWLATGGSWVETGDGPLLSALYLHDVVRGSWREDRLPWLASHIARSLGTVDKAVNISKLSQRFLKLLTVHEGRFEIYVKSFGAEVWD